MCNRNFDSTHFRFVTESGDDPSFSIIMTHPRFAVEVLSVITSRFSFPYDLYDFTGTISFADDKDGSLRSESYNTVSDYILKLKELI